MDFEDSPPVTPTKSEFDTFQVLSNSNFVDFTKDKPTSLKLQNVGSPKSPMNLQKSPGVGPSPPKTPPKVLNNPEDDFEKDDYDDYQGGPNFPGQVMPEPPSVAPSFPPSVAPSQTKTDEPLNEYYKDFKEKDYWTMEKEEPLSPIKTGKTKKHAFDEESINSELEMEIEAEKEALLQELSSLEAQGNYVPIKRLTLKDKLEEIQFQYDKVQSELNTNQGVEMVKSGIKMGSVVLEFVLKKFGIGLVEGFSSNLNKDPSKFNRPLTKLYKKYWRRGSSSPEMELAMIVLGSLAWTMIQNKMHGVGNVKPELEEKKKDLPTPPKVNLMQFQKEKDLQNRINELEKKLETYQSEPDTPPAKEKVMVSPKKVNLNVRTHSIASNASMKKKTQIKL